MNIDKRLLRQARKSQFKLLLTIGLGFAAGILTVLQAGYLSRIINAVFLNRQTLAGVNSLLALLLGVILLRTLLAWGSELAASAIALQVKQNLRYHLFEHLLSLGPAYVRGERTGELTNTALEGIEALEAYFSQYLPQLVLAGLVPLTFLLFVFPLDLISGIVLLVTAPLIPIFMILIGNLAQTLTQRQWRTLSRMSAYFLDVLQGLTTLKILGRSRAQSAVIAQVSEQFRERTMGVLRVTFLSALVLEMVATLSTAVVAVEVGLRLLYGRLSFEQAFFVLLLAPEFYLPLRLLGTRFHAGMSGVAAAKRIFAILETPGRQEFPGGAPDAEHSLPVSETAFREAAISFKDVHFSYEDERPALKGVSFEMFPGQKVALVGPSGSGKSTIANLLLGFIEPKRGMITIGETPLSALSTAEWRARIAWVPQNPYLFNESVAANIRLGCPDASLEAVIQAARLAHAHEFIQSLPQGYNTPIGERGARLSAGQAQRIALARAFLKDAPFVILDEATANLDLQNETLIRQAVTRLLQNRTALIIAHRLSTVYQADQIIVLDEGQVAESGIHNQLVSADGLYRRLANAFWEAQPLEPLVEKPSLSLEPAALTPGDGTPLSPMNATGTNPRSPFIRLLRFISPFKGLVALSVLLGFATIASSIGLMTTSAYIISAAALQPSIAVLQVSIVGVRFFGIARGLFRYLERYSSHQVTFRLLKELRVWFYSALEPLAPARLLQYRSGDLLARILGDIESLENFYVRVLAPPLVAFLTAVLVSLFLARFASSLALALLAFLLAAGVGIPLLVHILSRSAGAKLVDHQSNLNATLVDGIQGMADILAYGQGSSQIEQVDRASCELIAGQRQMAHINALQIALENLLANLGMWVILFLAIPLVSSGQMAGVYLAVVVLAALTSFEAVQPLPAAVQHLESNLQAARRLFEIVDTQPEVVDPAVPLLLPEAFQLQVNHLSFHYPQPPAPLYGSESPDALDQESGDVLHDINFSLSPGKHIAIVGPSGAGKTTLINLLLRFWEYDQGEILLGDRDLRCYNQEDLRSRMAVVSQNTYLFNASVRENLLIARPKASEAEILHAAQLAQIHEFIQSLPQGYQTWIGEQGLRLSGGERQRLAIARALLKDSPLLILDEPTANLDALTEREVLHAIKVLMAGCATLTITHRLVGLEEMDEILVLQAGRIVERGTHVQLLHTGGLYRRLWELQSEALAEQPV